MPRTPTNICLRVDPAIIHALHAAAERANVCVNRWITLALIDSLKRDKACVEKAFPIQRVYRRRRAGAQVETQL